MKPELGKTYLVTTDNWFVAPDGVSIKTSSDFQPKTIGESKDIVIVIDDIYKDINFIHAIEKELDLALVKLGFTRTTTSKNNKTILNYVQFGKGL